MKDLILNVSKSHNVRFKKIKFKVFKNPKNQSNDEKIFDVFLLYWLCISSNFNNFLEFNYDVIKN